MFSRIAILTLAIHLLSSFPSVCGAPIAIPEGVYNNRAGDGSQIVRYRGQAIQDIHPRVFPWNQPPRWHPHQRTPSPVIPPMTYDHDHHHPVHPGFRPVIPPVISAGHPGFHSSPSHGAHAEHAGFRPVIPPVIPEHHPSLHPGIAFPVPHPYHPGAHPVVHQAAPFPGPHSFHPASHAAARPAVAFPVPHPFHPGPHPGVHPAAAFHVHHPLHSEQHPAIAHPRPRPAFRPLLHGGSAHAHNSDGHSDRTHSPAQFDHRYSRLSNAHATTPFIPPFLPDHDEHGHSPNQHGHNNALGLHFTGDNRHDANAPSPPPAYGNHVHDHRAE